MESGKPIPELSNYAVPGSTLSNMYTFPVLFLKSEPTSNFCSNTEREVDSFPFLQYMKIGRIYTDLTFPPIYEDMKDIHRSNLPSNI